LNRHRVLCRRQTLSLSPVFPARVPHGADRPSYITTRLSNRPCLLACPPCHPVPVIPAPARSCLIFFVTLSALWMCRPAMANGVPPRALLHCCAQLPRWHSFYLFIYLFISLFPFCLANLQNSMFSNSIPAQGPSAWFALASRPATHQLVHWPQIRPSTLWFLSKIRISISINS
jgi:hypothetical protein